VTVKGNANLTGGATERLWGWRLYVSIGCLILIVATGVSAALGGDSHIAFRFTMLAIAYIAIAVLFLVGYNLRSISIFQLPVFVTLLAVAEFGLAPLFDSGVGRPLDPGAPSDQQVLFRALVLVTVGMSLFWLGCRSVGRRRIEAQPLARPQALAATREASSRTLRWAIVLFLIGFSANAYLLKSGLASTWYTQSWDTYFSNLPLAQPLNFIAQFGTYALVIVSLQRFGRGSTPATNVWFWIIFLSQCLWGVVSGMKLLLLLNPFLVALIMSFRGRKYPRKLIFATLLGVTAIYPFFEAYRAILRGTEGLSITNLPEASRAVKEAVTDAAGNSPDLGTWLSVGWQSTVSRFDELQTIGAVLSLEGSGARLGTGARVWMIPFYPFVPRMIWPNKPVFDTSIRLSEALGYGAYTATNVTYPADLYREFGGIGVLLGMFLWGVAAQAFTNYAYHGADHRLFIYAAAFLDAGHIERDLYSFWTGLVKSLLVLSIVAWAVYRPVRSRSGWRRRIWSGSPSLGAGSLG
jgi:hypothetical protein